jgi:hypothetical protein
MAAPAFVTPTELAESLGWPDGADTSGLVQPCDTANVVVDRWLDPDLGPHDAHPQDKEAALAVAVQIYSSRTAPGGQMQALDFGQITTPHLLGPGLHGRVMGLLGVCRRHGGLVVG